MIQVGGRRRRAPGLLVALVVLVAGCVGGGTALSGGTVPSIAVRPSGAAVSSLDHPSVSTASPRPVVAPRPSSAARTARTSASRAGLTTGRPTVVHRSEPCARQRVCWRVDVGEWDSIPFTPAIACGSSGETCPLLMDIYAPTSGGPWPLIVVLPGGPQAPASMDHLSDLSLGLAAQGAVVMVSSWRQADWFAGGYPTSFQDIACAIGVARRIGPAYGARPERVTLVGHSLGGWAAPIIGLTPKPFVPTPGSCNPTAGSLRPEAVVSIDGALDELTTMQDGNDYVQGFVGGDQVAQPKAWAASDPFVLARRYPAAADAIPFLLIHGGADTLVLPEVSRAFQDALVAAGYGSRLVEVPSANHRSITAATETIDAIITLVAAR